MKCLLPGHAEAEKKCNKFNCFEYKKTYSYPYEELRSKNKKPERLNLKDYQSSDQRRNNKFDNYFFDESNKYSSSKKESALDHYRNRF